MNGPISENLRSVMTSYSKSTCQVILDQIEVMAKIGAHRPEREISQPLRVSVILDIVPPVADTLDSTFDYADIETFARELATIEIALIETFARRLAEKFLAYSMVLGVEVRIEKPKAVPGCMAGTRITLAKT
jgi:7,8-dihydroneopterin aldolase/epimerase/oxygenase